MILRSSVKSLVSVVSVVQLATSIAVCASSEVREYPCYRLVVEPRIDGDIAGDPAWEVVPEDQGFFSVYVEAFGVAMPAAHMTSFRMGYDSSSLYVAVNCQEPWIRYLEPGQPRSEEFRPDDGIELLMAPDQTGSMAHFIVNALGSRWSGSEPSGEALELAGWAAKSRLQDDCYTVEIKLPFGLCGSSPAPGDVWRWNMARHVITINCPEDRLTSWSPVRQRLFEPESFGHLAFREEFLSPSEAAEETARLRRESTRLVRKSEEAFARRESDEAEHLRDYLERMQRQGRGITGVSRGVVDLVEPPTTPRTEVWRYGLGFPIQISPTKAGLLCNIRKEGSGNIDFEIGTDLVIFDDLDRISDHEAIPLSRYETDNDPTSGASIVRKGPILGGFVPVGACLPDGTPHPHAGTGFGMCWAIRHRVDAEGHFDYLNIVERYAMLYQFSYDGERFRILQQGRVDAATLLPDWRLAGNFITNAIPDGPDLLYVMVAREEDHVVAGVTRWQRSECGWHPVSFVPVTGSMGTWSEPSLVREADGGLLFSARSGDRTVPVIAFDIGLWRSHDAGKTWSKVLYEKNRRARSPVSVNRGVDGTPFIAANIPPLRRTRETLCLWPIDDARTDLECRITARDAKAEFGPAPSGSWWRVDHPTSAVIRLADGRWHGVLVYRVADNGEIEGSALPAAQTGCYIEEVFSLGSAVPPWHFQSD